MKKLLFALLAIVVAACETGQQQNATKTLVLNDSIPAKDYSCQITVKADFAAGTDAVAKAINDTLAWRYFGKTGSPEEAMQAWHDSLANEYMDCVNHFDADSPMLYWSHEVTAKEISSMPGMRTFEHSYYDYTGGAHGYYATFYHHFDTSTGAPLDMKQVLGLSPEEALPMVQAELAEQLCIPVEGLEEAGFWPVEDWAIPMEFFMRSDSVYFHFNIYEAACYAVGPVDVGMPLKRVKP